MTKLRKLSCFQDVLNTLEGIRDSEYDAKIYRTHCHEFGSYARKFESILETAVVVCPDAVNAFSKSDEMRALSFTLRDGLLLMRKCANSNVLFKLMNRGELKHEMEALIALLRQDCNAAENKLRSLAAVENAKQAT
ncbi:unnamed protein product [Closterium sp. Yama58-4]|nr:unnamed protein product [Closterium sp. Yama58-4]